MNDEAWKTRNEELKKLSRHELENVAYGLGIAAGCYEQDSLLRNAILENEPMRLPLEEAIARDIKERVLLLAERDALKAELAAERKLRAEIAEDLRKISAMLNKLKS